MRRQVLGALLLLVPGVAAAQVLPRIIPRPGLVLTRSTRLAPGVYRLAAPASLDSALIVVRGDNLTLDLRGVTLEGSSSGAEPDRAQGVALRIEGGHTVRILGGTLRGYRVAVLARGTRRLTLAEIDASRNWKPRLYSIVEHESLADWLSYHHNEKDEWLRYGAAFYLSDVQGGQVRGCRVRQGMNGLLLVRSDSLLIEDNDFSFNSGLGIGLYRASDNRILANRLDYNVRGYSHGFYHRGQDSAGLLLYEQSMRNVVAWNSVTHGGDGLFLWAGQTSMDSGTGGANDNLFYRNDFSFAPANGMEATFSRNRFIANRAVGSDYGLWGGYSYESQVVANCFAGNRTGLAIEHGQDNLIAANHFAGDTTAISLWGDPIEPSDWGYPKHRDTRSRDYRIERNAFLANRVALRTRQTAGVTRSANRYRAVDTMLAVGDTLPLPSESGAELDRVPASVACDEVPPAPAGFPLDRALGPDRPIPSSGLTRMDRSAIVVDEWGPYDWAAPRLWPLDSARAVPLRLRTLGPAGRWTVAAQHGVALLSRRGGRIGDTIAVTPSQPGDWALELEYHGATGGAKRFSYSRFEPAVTWTGRFFGWDDSTDLRSLPERMGNVSRQSPLLTRELARLDMEWYRPGIPGLPRERWALEATTTVELPRGSYQLRTISDDGIRVWVDGVLRIDHWKPHESEVDVIALEPGRHALKVHYYQADGWTELRLEILRWTSRKS